MNDLNRGRIETISRLCKDPDTKLDRKSISSILQDVLQDEDDGLIRELTKFDDPDRLDTAGRLHTCTCSVPLREVRAYGQELLREGTGLIPALRTVLDTFGMSQSELARAIGVSDTTLSMGLNGRGERKKLLCALTEFFGEDGLASEEKESENE